MLALVSPQENNRVVEVGQTSFPVALPLYWLDCSDDVKAGWTLTPQGFIPPEVETNTIEILEVSMRQARLALLQYNMLNSVNTAIANGNLSDQIEWEYATTVRKDSPLVLNMINFLGLTEQQVTNLFNVAATL